MKYNTAVPSVATKNGKGLFCEECMGEIFVNGVREGDEIVCDDGDHYSIEEWGEILNELNGRH